MQHAKTRLFSPKWDSELLFYSTRWCLLLSVDILFMFLGHTNPKLWVAVNTIVLYVCKLTELRKRQLKVEILHDLKEF